MCVWVGIVGGYGGGLPLPPSLMYMWFVCILFRVFCFCAFFVVFLSRFSAFFVFYTFLSAFLFFLLGKRIVGRRGGYYPSLLPSSLPPFLLTSLTHIYMCISFPRFCSFSFLSAFYSSKSAMLCSRSLTSM